MTIIPLTDRVELIQKRQEQLENIKSGLSKVKGEISKQSNKVAIGVGALLVGFLLYKLVFRSSRNVVIVPKEENSGNLPVQSIETIAESPIVAAIRGYIISFLLSLAKQKIQLFLDEMYNKKDGNDLQRAD